ncbi:MAG: PRC-barrel domain-containing protein [Endomicrobiales bacterium]
MLRNGKEIVGYSVCATDGEIGAVLQFHFDRETWTVRCLETKAGEWLGGRHVLISPIAVREIDDELKFIHLNLKRERVESSPRYSAGRPVSRRYEKEYYAHYGWPFYWGGSLRWGDELHPSLLFTAAPFNETPGAPLYPDTLALLTTGGIRGCGVFAPEGKIGQVEDLVLDGATWAVRFLAVNAESLAPGKTLLVSPHWISALSISEKMLNVDVPLEAARSAPSFEPSRTITRDDELRLFAHYGREREIDDVFVGRAPVQG